MPCCCCDKMQKHAMSKSMIKQLTTIARLAYIVYLNHLPSVRSLIIIRHVTRLKRKCATLQAWQKVMAAYHRVDDLRSPAG